MTSVKTLVAVASCSLFLVVGCTKRAAQEECRKACEHVADLQLAPLKKQHMVGLHEAEEQLERAEKVGKANLDRLARELAAGNPHAVEPPRGLSAAALREWQRVRRAEDERLRQQRELAIAQINEHLADQRKQLAETKKTSASELTKAVTEAVSNCAQSCPKRSLDNVQCLLRTQAVEDIDICG